MLGVTVSGLRAQQKVANYYSGKRGTAQYEHFSFWANGSKGKQVEYLYGAQAKEQSVTLAGVAIFKGKKSIKVVFFNKFVLYITPMGNNLLVQDESGQYSKIVKWEYEGPVNGVGTYCDICAQNEDEAMLLVKKHYLK